MLDQRGPAAANTFLAALTDADRATLQPHLRTVHLDRGTVLVEEGSFPSRVYFPSDCLISQVVPTADGGIIESYTVGREGAFGLLAALSRRPMLTRSFVQIAGEAERLSTAALLEAFEASLAFRSACLALAATQLEQVQQLSACNAIHPVEARLARWLLMVQDRIDSETLPLTHEFLAQMLGVQRPTVTVVARTLQGGGMIRYRRGLVEILDRPGLEEAACECYAMLREQQDRPLAAARGKEA